MNNLIAKDSTKQKQLINHFKSLILSGVYKPGDLLPPEITLAKEFGVNRTTMSKALGSLAGNGILLRRQGSGTYVAKDLDLTALCGGKPDVPSIPGLAHTIAIASCLRIEDPNFKLNPHTQILAGIETHLPQLLTGSKVFFANAYPQLRIDPTYIANLRRSGVTGLIYLVSMSYGQEFEDNLRELRTGGIPFVAVIHDESVPDIHHVSAAQIGYGYHATRHLLSLGHRKLCYLAPEFDRGWLTRRINGFRQALYEAGIAFTPPMLLRLGNNTGGEEGQVSGREAAKALLEQMPEVTGVVTVNDAYALGLMDGLDKLGVRVPDQISVVGTDDTLEARFQNLTTVRQPFREIGEAAAQLMAQKLTRPETVERFEHWQINPSLVVRQTTARPAVPATE